MPVRTRINVAKQTLIDGIKRRLDEYNSELEKIRANNVLTVDEWEANYRKEVENFIASKRKELEEAAAKMDSTPISKWPTELVRPELVVEAYNRASITRRAFSIEAQIAEAERHLRLIEASAQDTIPVSTDGELGSYI